MKVRRGEDIEHLPKFEGRKEYITRVIGNMWDIYDYKNPSYRPWKIANRIIEHNIGKSFALAFSYYCKKVRKQDQFEFLKDFEEGQWGCRNPEYYVDEQGLIQRAREPRRYSWQMPPYKVSSYEEGDYEIYIGWRGAVQVKSNKFYEYSLKDYKYKRQLANQQKKLKSIVVRYNRKLSRFDWNTFINKISKSTYEMIQERKQAHLNWKQLQIDQKKRAKEEEIAKIISLGFDPITSFRH